MAQSDTEICNLALSAIGTRSSIASLMENSAEARACNLHYKPTVDAVLQAAFWNFARRQVALAVLLDASKSPPDPTPSPWIYEYAYPSDCLQARYIMPMFNNQPASAPGTASQPFYVGAPVRFVISQDSDAAGNDIKVILTNQAQAQLIYTKRVTDVTMFDATFTQAVAAYLGHRLCIALTGDKAMAKMQFELASQLTLQARASNGNEGLTIIDQIPDWMRVRGYASDWAFPPGSMMFTAPQSLTMIS